MINATAINRARLDRMALFAAQNGALRALIHGGRLWIELPAPTEPGTAWQSVSTWAGLRDIMGMGE